MKEAAFIFVASHVLIVICCLWMFGMVCRMLYRRPGMFIHPWAMIPVLAWLLFKGLSHVGYVVLILIQRGHTTVIILVALNAVAALIACIAVRFVFVKIVDQPTIADYKTTTDALARTLGELSSEKEPR